MFEKGGCEWRESVRCECGCEREIGRESRVIGVSERVWWESGVKE